MRQTILLTLALIVGAVHAGQPSGQAISIIVNGGEQRFYEATGNGGNYVGFKSAATLAGDKIWTLPSADGTNGQILQTNGSGVLSWVNNSLAANVALRDATNTFAEAQTFQKYIATQVASPAQITATQNNYDVGTASLIRGTSNASHTITGFANGVNGRHMWYVNIGSSPIILSHQNAGSSAANRITTPTGADVTLSANYGAHLIYDATDSAWRLLYFYQVAGTGSITGSGTADRVVRWTGASAQSDSVIRDDGTNIGVGAAPDASYRVNVSGAVQLNGQIRSLVNTGTAPFVLSSSTKVTGLNVDSLDDQSGSFYTNASNLDAGTVPDARMPALTGDVTTSAGAVATTVASVAITGKAAEATVADDDLILISDTSEAAALNKMTRANFLGGTLPAASGVNLTALNATQLTSGTVPDARMPALTGDVTTSAGAVATTLASVAITGKAAEGTVADDDLIVISDTSEAAALNKMTRANFLGGTLPAASGVNLTALNATQLTSGTVPDARFPATLPAASGVNLTALNATQLTSGTIPDARLPANPSFSVSRNGTNQTGVLDNTFTKIKWTTEDFDVGSYFVNDADDSGGATESRYTPPAGKYLITLNVSLSSVPDQETVLAGVYVNGSLVKRSQGFSSFGASAETDVHVAVVIALDGDDYVEGYVYHTRNSSPGTLTLSGTTTRTWMTGVRVSP